MVQKFTLSVDESCKFKFNHESVVGCINQNGCKLYYVYDEIYKYLEDRRDLFGESFNFIDDKVGTYKSTFLKNYIESVKQNAAYVYPIKLLIDTLIYQPVRTVFGFYDGSAGVFNLSKGSKKLIAFDVLGITNAHILIVSKDDLPNQIKSDEELYWLLRKIDPHAHRFDIIIDNEDSYPIIHYAESVSTIGKWSIMTDTHKELFKQTMPNIPAKVKFTGLAHTTDDRINICDEDYYCWIHSDKEINVSLDYLYMCSSNMFYKQKIRVGTTFDDSIRIEYNRTNPAGYADFFIPNP